MIDVDLFRRLSGLLYAGFLFSGKALSPLPLTFSHLKNLVLVGGEAGGITGLKTMVELFWSITLKYY